MRRSYESGTFARCSCSFWAGVAELSCGRFMSEQRSCSRLCDSSTVTCHLALGLQCIHHAPPHEAIVLGKHGCVCSSALA